ncbi:protoglobin domain-containing protein [Corynebacterium guangdongense]|uniref:Globin-sensor domain-containing protein n=1 Tax=Corynebacterium guangdongense TaxID=1783348 RepID=A0ABU1ZY30_9CORY|nr:protoglobin domain-containing protein [Corynebacterium guangdongense]MDR7329841.1 hypothetical protein [Corynebacterium guangdongense]WJZ18404.1 Protoglobin [Corynebacterium guangdongense]
MSTTPPGYDYEADLPPSPVSEDQFAQLLTDVMWTDADQVALRRAGAILEPRVPELLDAWYDFIGSTPHLAATFRSSRGNPDTEYLARVRARFERWVVDLCTRDFDARWLAYQEEIGKRHHPQRKNVTDHVDSGIGHVPMKDMMALIVPVTLTVRGFLEQGETDRAQVDDMQVAWFKALTVTLVLWARPYAGDLW